MVQEILAARFPVVQDREVGDRAGIVAEPSLYVEDKRRLQLRSMPPSINTHTNRNLPKSKRQYVVEFLTANPDFTVNVPLAYWQLRVRTGH